MVGRVKRKIKWLLLPAACLSAGAASAQTLPSVFGLQLGAPVTLPECQHMEGVPAGSNGVPAYEMAQPVTCVQQPYELGWAALRQGTVVFTREQTPELSAANMIGVYFSKGSDKVIAIEAATPGYEGAAYIIAQLTAKFGKPTSADEDRRIVGKVSVLAKHVVWKRNGFTVDYQSVASSVRAGELLVSTDEYDRLASAGDAAQNAKRTPL